MISIFGFTQLISNYLWGYIAVLITCTVSFYILNKSKPSRLSKNLLDRTLSWWVILALFIVFVGISTHLTYIALALVSFIAHREIVSNIKLPTNSRRAVLWSYLAIPVQYYIAYMGNQILFFTFIPVAMFFLLSLRTVIEDEPSESLKVFTHLHWSLILTTFTISHIAYLTSLPSIPGEENPHQALIFFLIFLTQSNDIFQYIFGMTLGKKPISPKISPKKTIVGAVGGVAGSLVLSYLFASAMPLSVTQCLTVGFFVSIAGLLGDLNISAIKRSLDVKDMSNLIPGHGGILDRIDSLTFSSIIYFYIIFYWIYL